MRVHDIARYVAAWLLVLAVVGAPACAQRREAAEGGPPRVATPATGDIRARTVAEYEVGKHPRGVAVADFDRNGRPDVAVANAGDGTVTFLFQRLDGTFDADATAQAGREPADLEAVDLDRDGDADLAVANHETSNVTILLNDGRGAFAQAAGSPHDTGARPHVHSVAAGDFDADGWPDVAVESADTRELRILRGGPAGLSPPLAVPIGTMPYSRVVAGDWNGDGRPELIVPGHRDNTLRIVERGEGRFVEEPKARLSRQPWVTVAADLNGDSRSDVVVVETDGISLWISTEEGLREAPGSPYDVRGATEAAVGDLDGDSVADVAVAPWDGDAIHVLDGRSKTWYRVPACERPVGLAIADLDGDGRGSLIAGCTTGNRILVMEVAPAEPAASSPDSNWTPRPDWARYFDEAGVTGTIAVLDERSGARSVHNEARARTRYLPASTFKIPHALFALDAGVVRDGSQQFRWDGVKREIESWNRDHDLRSSMQHSVVWVYQKFAREIGEARERRYLKRARYGNADPSGGLEVFWLEGALRISAIEQVDFLRRLHREDLPFRVEHQRRVKDVIVVEGGRDWLLRAKTGWQARIEPNVGWWVGWVERSDGAVFFALNIDMPRRAEDLPKRESIARAILRSIGALPAK
jgi:beta-lactamase class D